MRSATPASWTARDRVAAADDRVAVVVGDRLRDAERALGEPRPLEDSHRPVPEHRLRAADHVREVLATVSGRLSRPSQPSGNSSNATASSRHPPRTSRRRRRHRQDHLERERGSPRAPARPSCRRSRRHPRAHRGSATPRSCPRPSRRPRRSRTAARPLRAACRGARVMPQEQQSRVRRERVRDAPVDACARWAVPNASLTKRSHPRRAAGALRVVLRLARVEAHVLEHRDPLVVDQSCGRARTGAIRMLARSSSVFGRPRCEARAPLSRRARAVARLSAATRGCGYRRRLCRLPAARSGHCARGPPDRRHRLPPPTPGASNGHPFTRSTSRQL